MSPQSDEPIRRLANGAIDYRYYERRARAIRSVDAYMWFRSVADLLRRLRAGMRTVGRPDNKYSSANVPAE